MQKWFTNALFGRVGANSATGGSAVAGAQEDSHEYPGNVAKESFSKASRYSQPLGVHEEDLNLLGR